MILIVDIFLSVTHVFFSILLAGNRGSTPPQQGGPTQEQIYAPVAHLQQKIQQRQQQQFHQVLIFKIQFLSNSASLIQGSGPAQRTCPSDPPSGPA